MRNMFATNLHCAVLSPLASSRHGHHLVKKLYFSVIGLALVTALICSAHMVTYKSEYKLMFQYAWNYRCKLPYLRQHDFSSLPHPSITFQDGVTHEFIKLKDMYTSGFSIPNPEACQNEKVSFVVTIPANPGNRTSRDAIRATWGKMLEEITNGAVKVIFFVGQTTPDNQKLIRQEAATEGDIVQANVQDHSRKAVINKEYAMLNWVAQYCPPEKVTHVMKADDDVYVNAPALVDYWQRVKHVKRSIHGRRIESFCAGYNGQDEPVTIDSSLPVEVYPYTQLPDFIGQTYFYTRDVAEHLVEAGQRSMYWDINGDEYVTGILAEMSKVDINRVSEPRFLYLFGDSALRVTPSDLIYRMYFRSAIIVSHNMFLRPIRGHIYPEMMYKIHEIMFGYRDGVSRKHRSRDDGWRA